MNRYISPAKCKLYLFIFYLLFCLYSQAAEYQKESLPKNNEILTGISRKEALNKFGIPTAINKNLWYYNYPHNFYIRFPNKPSISSFFIVPYYYNINKNLPFEMKAFIVYDNFRTVDITPYVQWSIENKNIVRQNGNIFFPLKEGKTEIFALYNGLVSLPSHIHVESSKRKRKYKKETLLSINIFPHNPYAEENSSVTFTAFGTFINTKKRIVFVKNISSKVKWFVSRNNNTEENGGQTIYTYDKGTIYVFCEYEGIKSAVEKVSVQNNARGMENRLKNIYLIPQIITADEGTTVIMRAVATYFNNRVEDVTNDLLWKIDNADTAILIDKGALKLKKEGITKVEGHLSDTSSFFSKIIVKRKTKRGAEENIRRNKNNYANKIFQHRKIKTLPNTKENVEITKEIPVSITREKDINNILENIEDTLYKLSAGKRTIKSLSITPLFKTIPLGEETNFKAYALYNDGTKTDVTDLARWQSSDPYKVSIEKGKITALLTGEADIKAYLGKTSSNTSHITITPPALVSISLSREKIKVPWRENISIKASGHYTDNSTKDITSIVKWRISNKKVLGKKGKNVFIAKKTGSSEIYCEYKKIKSLPVKVYVFMPPATILKMILLCIIVLLTTVFFTLYIAAQVKIMRLKKTYRNNPRGLIKEIYNNIRNVLSVLGLPNRDTIPPYAYAEMVNNAFSIKDDIFIKLADKFSEAEYSKHTITQDDADSFIKTYNTGMRKIKSNISKFPIKYLLLLIHRLPFII